MNSDDRLAATIASQQVELENSDRCHVMMTEAMRIQMNVNAMILKRLDSLERTRRMSLAGMRAEPLIEKDREQNDGQGAMATEADSVGKRNSQKSE